jgi:hypothetical protein
MTTPTPNDFRELCAELLEKYDLEWRARERIKTFLSQPEPDTSQLSDGYHTFAELYEHRHALCLALMRAMPQHCWYSLRHADGERCFGGADWFIVGIELPGGSSVTYHLPAELYAIAQATGAAELEKGRPWDGHTAADVVSRLREWAALGEPEPQGPTDEELLRTYGAAKRDHCYEGPMDDWPKRAERAATVHGLRAVLTRFGRPAIESVPVAERPWEREGWCDADEKCWFGAPPDGAADAGWILRKPSERLSHQTVSLPHWALPVPQQEATQ